MKISMSIRIKFSFYLIISSRMKVLAFIVASVLVPVLAIVAVFLDTSVSIHIGSSIGVIVFISVLGLPPVLIVVLQL